MNELFKALSHPVRREILKALREGPLASGDIASRFDMTWPTVTGHLAVLRDAGLLESERAGNSIRYRLNVSAAEEAMVFLLDLAGAGNPSMPSKRSKAP
jgi:DNA-binding transcriptional ArsR family regulator